MLLEAPADAVEGKREGTQPRGGRGGQRRRREMTAESRRQVECGPGRGQEAGKIHTQPSLSMTCKERDVRELQASFCFQSSEKNVAC